MTEQTSNPDVRIVVTMPAFKAERTLEQTIKDLPERLRKDVIVVDDASPDGTVTAARRLGLKVVEHAENQGYGGNQKTCYSTALAEDADIVVMLHPDYQYDPKAVPLLIAPLLSGDADMTFGSRFAGLSDPRAGGMPWFRYVGNRVTTTVQNAMLGTRFTELHSGMRAYTAAFLRSVPFLGFQDGFEFDSEMIVAAIAGGHRVVEVPIPTRYSEHSSSIAVWPSVRYVGHAMGTAAAARLRLGGRGARRRLRRPERVPAADPVAGDKMCVMCGSQDWRLIYPRTATGPVDVSEFACTTNAVSIHDDIVDCAVCGLRASVPQLSHDDIVDNYEQVIDDDYLEEEEARRETFEWILDSLAGYALPQRRLLEFGSNVGLFLAVAGEHGWDASGIEPSHWAVAQGRSRFGVRLNQGTVEAYHGDNAVDAIVMLDVLEHVTDPMSVLRHITKMVDEDGILVLSTVDTRSLHSRVRKGRWPWYIRSHLHYFTRPVLAEMLRNSGFEMVEWRNVPRSFRLSYIVHKGGWDNSNIGRILMTVSRVVDLRIPAGWLGDIKLVVARRIP